MQTAVIQPENQASKSSATKGNFFGGSSSSPFFQPKLTVNQPGDEHEREADSVADQVMRMRSGDTPVIQRMQFTTVGNVQRMCADCEKEVVQRKENPEEEDQKNEREAVPLQRKETSEEGPLEEGKLVQRKCDACEEEAALQRKSNGADKFGKKTAPAIVSEVLASSGGRPLDAGLRQFMESRIGHDFSNVRIHNDAKAAESAASIQARAFTSGNNIVFGAGEYQPETDGGQMLLAHELTHVVQQGKSIVKRKEAPVETLSEAGEQQACLQITPSSAATNVNAEQGADSSSSREITQDNTPAPAAQPTPENKNAPANKKTTTTVAPMPGTAATSNAEAEAPKEIPKNQPDDPAFAEFADETKKKARGQKKHEEENKKAVDAQAASTTDAQKSDAAINSGARVLSTAQIVEGDGQKTISAASFKSKLRTAVSAQFPNKKDEYKTFKAGNGIETLKGQPKVDLQEASKDVTDGARTISNPGSMQQEKKGEIVSHQTVPMVPEAVGNKPHFAQVERAAPKPLPEEEFQLPKDKNAESLDREMKANNMADQQLADSDEPTFIETLETKRDSQVKLCQFPGQMKAKETTMITGATKEAQSQAAGTSTAMHAARKAGLEDVLAGQENLTTEDAAKLQQYYNDIEIVFTCTENAVKLKLDCLDCQVAEIFDAAVDANFEIFKDNVEERLDDYYGADLLIGTVSNEDEEADDEVRSSIKWNENRIWELELALKQSEPQDTRRPRWEQELPQRKARLHELKGVKLIIDKIFEEEKALFMGGLDAAIDTIALLVETELNDAKRIIREGKSCVEAKSKTLPENLQTAAKDKTEEFVARFNDLESTVDDKEADLIDSLAKQYAENVGKLAEEFEKIRAEEAMSIWEKAWRKIKEIALTIYNLGKLLVKVIIKAAEVIGDILAHPIRFIENLISAVGEGFRNFKKNITKHLTDIVFKLLMKVVPPGVEFPREWNGKGVLTFILSLMGLSKANIRKQAVDKLGEPVVGKLEQGFEWFVILKKEGFGGLWEHVKEKVGNVKDEIVSSAITFFKEQIIWKAVEFLLSVLTPVSGFIKACKSIYSIVTFFLKNLENILKLFESILDSFADMVAGRIGNAALRIETAFADLLLVGIKFLAALIGINLDKIQEKIGRIVKAVQGRVNRAISWVIDKGRDFARKTGITKAAQKVKAGVDKGKEWAKEKVEKGKAVGKAVAGKVLDFFGVKTKFKDGKGATHNIYYEKSGDSVVLVVASDPKNINDFLDFYVSEFSIEPKSEKGKEVKAIRDFVEDNIRTKVLKLNKAKGTAKEADLQQQLLDENVVLSSMLKALMTGNRAVGNMIESYRLEGLTGTYDSIPNPTGDELTPDHQPQAAILQEAAKMDFFGTTSPMAKRAANRAKNGYAINLYSKRHIEGRTYGGKGGGTLEDFRDDTKKALKGKKTVAEKREVVVEEIRNALDKDVDAMKLVIGNDANFADIDELSISAKEKKDLKKDIKSRISTGEDQLKNQELDSLKNS